MQGLSSLIEEIIDRLFDIKQLTKTQRTAIEMISKGYNVLLIAPTGSGKTEAAILPVFEKLRKEKNKKDIGVRALYITPLRALNRDIFQRIVKIGNALGISVEIRHGDTSLYQRRKQTLSPPDVLITTPETFQILLVAPRFRHYFKKLKFIIVDELHELADNKRGIQLSVGLKRLESFINEQSPQKIGLSATIKNAKEISKLLVGAEPCKIIKSTETRNISVSIDAPNPQKKEYPKREYSNNTSSLLFNEILLKVLKYINENEGVIVFTNTRVTAEILSANLMKLTERISVHHSSLSKEVRIESESAFKARDIKSIVCTSSLELGIDIGHVDFVVQFMSPRMVCRLIQRVGRSGHRISGLAKGVILTPYLDELLESAVIAKLAENQDIEPICIYKNAYDVLAHQIIGIVLVERSITRQQIYNIIKKAYPYQNMQFDEFESVVNFMISERQIFGKGDLLEPSKATRELYFKNISTIPDTKQYEIVDLSTRRRIGVLDDEFVVKNLDVGSFFILFGLPWKVVSMEDERIYVEQESDEDAVVARWIGENIPVPFKVASLVNKLRIRLLKDIKHNQNLDYLITEYNLTEDAYFYVLKILSQVNETTQQILDENTIYIEYTAKVVVLNTSFGTLVNNTLALLLSSLISSQYGVSIPYTSDAYRVILELPSAIIPPEQIISTLKSINPKHIGALMRTIVKNTSLFLWQLKKAAEKFGILERGAKISKNQLRALLRFYKDTPLVDEAIRETIHFKFDIKRTESIIEKIKNGELRLQILSVHGLSTLTELSPTFFSRKSIDTSKDIIVVDIVKRRLLRRRLTLTCMYCGKWSSRNTLNVLMQQNEIICPICKSKLIAVSKFRDKQFLRSVFEKYRKQKKLTKEEQQILKEGISSANLVLTYGTKALLVLAARGIGPETAKRILSKKYDTEYQLIKEIVEAERKYVRTHPFWKKP